MTAHGKTMTDERYNEWQEIFQQSGRTVEENDELLELYYAELAQDPYFS